MESMAEVIKGLPVHLTKHPVPELTIEEMTQQQVDEYNNRQGKLIGYDCSKCKNKGFIARMIISEYSQRPEMVVSDCECKEHRKYLRQLHQSGLEDAINNYTFKNYIVTHDWQKNLKDMCRKYFNSAENEWLFLGGQSGCGKTHLCTALCGRYLKKGKSVVYMMWREDSTQMKQAINSNPEYYDRKMERYKSADILYIDDLFKSGKGSDGTVAVSNADINLAFSILNYRSVKRLKTIISSELTIDEMRKIDEAIAGRIYEKSIAKGFGASIAYNPDKNYRFSEQK